MSQEVIDKVKAQSFDIVAGLNAQLQAAGGQVQNLNMILEKIVSVVAPDQQDISVQELVDILEKKFASTKPVKKGGKPSVVK